MSNVSAPSHPAATTVAATATPVAPPTTAVALAVPIEFDSSASDVISSRALYIKGLASCAACLTAVEARGGRFEGEELIPDALPSLNYVIMEMADQIAAAGDQLFAQYQQARAVANGKAVQS